MLAPMRFLAFCWLLLASNLPLLAQRSLAELQDQFTREARDLAARQQADRDPAADERQAKARDELLADHIRRLRTFVASAAGDDRWNGRLMLADLMLAAGDRKGAATPLQEIDAKQAPALLLVTAATMAQRLNLLDLRKTWVEAALAKEAPLADRLAMARLLITVLVEVEKGESLFAAALAQAKDDEQRAFVRWHRADAMRDREDLPENAAFDELGKLADELPNTYWGSVAKDRLRATMLRPGDVAIPVAARTLDGGTFTLAEQRGKVVLLAFWSAADRDMPALLDLLRTLKKQQGDQLAVLMVSLDRDPAAIRGAVQALGLEFPVVGDGLGVQTDLALRWFVEGPTVQVIGPDGKVLGLGQHAGTNDARTELAELVRSGLGR